VYNYFVGLIHFLGGFDQNHEVLETVSTCLQVTAGRKKQTLLGPLVKQVATMNHSWAKGHKSVRLCPPINNKTKIKPA
jgi:hypothetical protein